ncbi:hypothetical protein [Micromonospora sp. NBC_01796]|uniref:hypothetical protein n=1 Tax=Micromonospora sp. NBC_01796 TaxID=2975987 RepID=UPI002DD8C9B9|nr:hypothetical protein [Micromonospora sp. NBC_01796]WSA82862.1 hypothetical protein OIE47_20700 [Micromonospora sp. NBC_01796]
MTSDLHQLLTTAQSDQPAASYTVDDIVAAGRRRRSRRKFGQWTGATGGLAVVAVAVALVSQTGTATPGRAPVNTADAGLAAAGAGSATAGPTPLTYTFAGYRVGDFRVTDPSMATPGYQSSMIFQDNVYVGDGPPIEDHLGTMTVYRPGVFRPDLFRAGTPITVGGRPGFQTELPRKIRVGSGDPNSREVITKPISAPAVAWQYGDDAWAVIEAHGIGQRSLPVTAIRQLADAFRTAAPAPVRTPYEITYVPAGWQLVAAGSHNLILGDDAISRVVLVRTGTSFDALTAPLNFEDGTTPTVQIMVARSGTEGPYPHPVTPACPEGQFFCDLPIGTSGYYVEVHDQSSTLSGTEIRKIADGLVFATVDQPNTWHDAVTG